MILATAILVGLAAVMAIVAYRQDPARPAAGALAGLRLLWTMLPMLIAAFFVAGMLAVALPPQLVHRWLASTSGLLDVVIGSAAGALIPGGPYVSFPIIAAIHQAGASLAATVALITGWAVWNVGLLSFELAIVGPRFTLIRVAATLVLPPAAGLLVHAIFG
ncbi:MAG: permease [Deinococcales bacterium]|jgi:uncharacterized membrane protein YraQ (UPF0718 family)